MGRTYVNYVLEERWIWCMASLGRNVFNRLFL